MNHTLSRRRARPVPLHPSSGAGAFAVVLLLAGCIGRTPAQAAAHERCLAAAMARADKRSQVECMTGPRWDEAQACIGAATTTAQADACSARAWDECPAREEIMVELKRKQEECR